MMLDELDKKIIAALYDDFPLEEEPYRIVAAQIGISEVELIARLEKYRRTGKLRRMGAVLRHREVGYAANALCAWRIPADRLDQAAALMAADPAVTHCYTRVTRPGWTYNFYTMLHGHTREECRKIAAALAAAAGVGDYAMFFSTREWKKTSMRYFQEEELDDDQKL